MLTQDNFILEKKKKQTTNIRRPEKAIQKCREKYVLAPVTYILQSGKVAPASSYTHTKCSSMAPDTPALKKKHVAKVKMLQSFSSCGSYHARKEYASLGKLRTK